MATLSLCVICKNEESNIKNLLESVKGPLFDEIIVVDTGSTDKTCEIIKQYTDKLYHFKWINDFSAARNFSFSKATQEFLFWLDADDIIRPTDYQKLLVLKPKLDDSPIWLLKYEYAHDEFGNSICSFYRERIIKRSLNLKWQEPIHEYLPLAAPFQKADIEIHHYKQHTTSARNIPMLEDIVKKNPKNARNIYYLGKELFDVGQHDKGVPHLLKFIEMPDGWVENKYSALMKLANHYSSIKDNDSAIKYCHRAIQLELMKADAYCLLADIYLGNNQVDKAIHYYKIATIMGRPEGALDIIEPKYFTWLPHLQLCLAYNSVGKVAEAAAHNQIALNFRPNDSRMLNNKKIFINSLKEKYPQSFNPYNFDSDEVKIVPKEEPKSRSKPTFKGKIGWQVPNMLHAGTIRIRALNINKRLKELGYDSELYNPNNVDSYDYVVVGKSYSETDLKFVKFLKEKNIRVICDLSEEILMFPLVSETIKECDLVICCSEELRKKVSMINSNAVMIEDSVESILQG